MRVLPLLLCVACAASTKEAGLRDTSPYEFHRALAGSMLKTEQPRQAIEHIRQLQQLKPGDPEPFLLMGQAYVQLGVPDSAREMFERALARDPKLAGAHAALGVIYDGARDHVRAETEHRAALGQRPSDPAYHNNLGFCLYLQGRYGEAVRAYELALALDAGSRRAHNNLGFAYGRLGDYSRAYAHFKLAGVPAQAENNMGLVHEASGDREGATDFYRAALAADPKLDEARANLLRLQGGPP
jgi:Flp pilus assembly protein TadD